MLGKLSGSLASKLSTSARRDRDGFTAILECSDASSATKTTAVPDLHLCLKCNRFPILYYAKPCNHRLYCKTCAMKVCTGGKCRVCKEFFTGMCMMQNGKGGLEVGDGGSPEQSPR